MALIDSFELVANPKSNRTNLYMTFTGRKMIFSKALAETLDYSSYVKIYLDEEGKRVALAASKKEMYSFQFIRKQSNGSLGQAWISNIKLMKKFRKIAGIDEEKLYRFYGKKILDGGKTLVIIDLGEPEEK